MLNYKDTVNTMKSVSEKVTDILNDGRICFTLGGDHSIGFGTVHGHFKHNPKTVVFWIDAHADINTNFTSGTGNIHGMPIALLAKELHHLWPANMPGLEWKTLLLVLIYVYMNFSKFQESTITSRLLLNLFCRALV